MELLLPHLSDDGRVVYTSSRTHDPDSIDGRMVGTVVEPDAAALATTGRGGAKVLSAGLKEHVNS